MLPDEEVDGGIVARFAIGFLERFGKTSHTVSHSCSISAMTFCRFAWENEVVKVIGTLTDQRVGRSMGRSKDSNGLWIDNPQ